MRGESPCSRSERVFCALTTLTRSDAYPLVRSSQASLRNRCQVSMTTYRLCRRVSSLATWDIRPIRKGSAGTTEYWKPMTDTWLTNNKITQSRAQIGPRAWSRQTANARRRFSSRVTQRALLTLSTRSTMKPICDPCPLSRVSQPQNQRNQLINGDTQV